MFDFDESDCSRWGDRGPDEILTAFKARDLSITEAIKASMQVFGIGLGGAKALVTSHPAWVTTAKAAEPFHDDLIRIFQEAEVSNASARSS